METKSKSEEIQEAFARVSRESIMRPSVDSPDWRVLFIEYNKHNQKKLGMGCLSCYSKVFRWFRGKADEYGLEVINL